MSYICLSVLESESESSCLPCLSDNNEVNKLGQAARTRCDKGCPGRASPPTKLQQELTGYLERSAYRSEQIQCEKRMYPDRPTHTMERKASPAGMVGMLLKWIVLAISWPLGTFDQSSVYHGMSLYSHSISLTWCDMIMCSYT